MTSPNILIFMVDQLNGTLFPDGPAEWLRAPNLKKLGRFGSKDMQSKSKLKTKTRLNESVQ